MGPGYPSLTTVVIRPPVQKATVDMEAFKCVAEVTGYVKVILVAQNVRLDFPEHNIFFTNQESRTTVTFVGLSKGCISCSDVSS